MSKHPSQIKRLMPDDFELTAMYYTNRELQHKYSCSRLLIDRWVKEAGVKVARWCCLCHMVRSDGDFAHYNATACMYPLLHKGAARKVEPEAREFKKRALSVSIVDLQSEADKAATSKVETQSPIKKIARKDSGLFAGLPPSLYAGMSLGMNFELIEAMQGAGTWDS